MMSKLVRTNLANIISGIALLFCWLAIIFLLQDKFSFSFGLILLAFVFDALDGYLTRLLKINNPLGKALDGYVDVINYLVYPALVFLLFFKINSLISAVAIFAFLAAGVFRLARFEVRGIKKTGKKMYYEGLPVFFSPILIILFLFLSQALEKNLFNFLAITLILGTSFLMIQTFRFPKPKNILPIILGASVLSLLFLARIINFDNP